MHDVYISRRCAHDYREKYPPGQLSKRQDLGCADLHRGEVGQYAAARHHRPRWQVGTTVASRVGQHFWVLDSTGLRRVNASHASLDVARLSPPCRLNTGTIPVPGQLWVCRGVRGHRRPAEKVVDAHYVRAGRESAREIAHRRCLPRRLVERPRPGQRVTTLRSGRPRLQKLKSDQLCVMGRERLGTHLMILL
jgi:hypothetical protein